MARRVRVYGVLLIALVGCAAHHSDKPDASSGTDAAMVADAGRVPLNHRPVATTCDSNRPSVVPDGGFPDAGTCSFDSDCVNAGTSDSDGRCVFDTLDQVPVCTYDRCFSDADCHGAGVCGCRNGTDYATNICLMSNCNVDSDCGDGGYCSPTTDGCGAYIGIAGYYCHTPADECLNDSDCGVAGLFCVFDMVSQTRWICGTRDCAG